MTEPKITTLDEKRFLYNLLQKYRKHLCPRLSFSHLLRVANTCTTRGPREQYAWNTRLKQSVINDVLNMRFKRFNYFRRKNKGRL